VAHPGADVEIILLAYEVLRELGLEKRVTLELNTLGDPASRQAYRDVLRDYFRAHKAKLSEDSLERLERNPLRILDSKDEGDRRVVVDAPQLGDYLNQASQDFFAVVREGLDRLEIAYSINPHLVRGLDYYCHSIFEFTTTELGAQSTVLGGGRYDGLMELLGGPPTPGIGWAGGIERLALMLEIETPVEPTVALVPVGAEAEAMADLLARDLRRRGLRIDLAPSGNVKKRMKRANKISAVLAVLMGEDELQQNAVSLRDLRSGKQSLVKIDHLADRLAELL
jgi:histidyl-tRNA synthetase